MLSLLMFTVLATTIRSCSDRELQRESRLQVDNRALASRVYEITRPVRDYKIRTIDDSGGVMVVEAGDSLTDADLRLIASRLVTAFRDADRQQMGSDMFFVRIERHGRRVCHAQTYEGGVYLKLD